MKPNNLTRSIILLALAAVLLTACSTPLPTPAAIALAPTATAAPPTPLPTDTATASPTNVPTNTPTATATNTSTPTDTPTNTPTATATATPTDTPTATLVPPTSTNTVVPVTATRVPPSATLRPRPTNTPVSAFYTVAWKTGVQYNARTASSFWCQFHDEYQNNTTEEMPFQNKDTFAKNIFTLKAQGVIDGYEPVIAIANPDGTINRWQLAGWYAKAFGWPNGMADFPPKPIPAGSDSGDWTWYSVSNAGEFCRFVYIKWKGLIRAAEFSPKGDLISSHATLPPGAP